MAQYKLTYFDGRGYAEPIRQILVYSGVPFEDIRLVHGSLTADKKEELGLEWGVVPLLEIDGEKKSQSAAICRFLGRKFNLAGKNEAEEFRCDEICEAVRDFALKSTPLWTNSYVTPNPTKLEEAKKEFVEVASPVYLKRFNNLLEKQGKTWLVGDNVTYADIVFAHNITLLENAFNIQLAKDYPAVNKLISAVENLPKIKEWIEKRPKTSF